MGKGEAESAAVIRFRPAAARELARDVGYYDTHHTGRGRRFAEAVEATHSTQVGASARTS
jgi:hypothetical protein